MAKRITIVPKPVNEDPYIIFENSSGKKIKMITQSDSSISFSGTSFGDRLVRFPANGFGIEVKGNVNFENSGSLDGNLIGFGGSHSIDNDTREWIGQQQDVKGQTGDVGPQGPTQVKGAIGPTGAGGAQGPGGPTGDSTQGAKGPKGVKGIKGFKGPIGDKGFKGPQGSSPIGNKGPQGSSPQGPQGGGGPKGIRGGQGPVGNSTQGDRKSVV